MTSTLRGHRWLASALRSSGTAAAAGALDRLGNCAANRIGDRAGGYRRIAAGLATLPGPLILAAVGGLLAEEPSIGSALARILVAGACGWLAWDLVKHASANGADGSPHTSSIALAGGIVLLAILVAREETAVVGFGPPALLVLGLFALTGGYVVFAAAMRHHERLLAMVGRAIVVVGAGLVGVMEFGRAVFIGRGSAIEAVGLGLVAVVLLLTAACEARVLVRGAALYRTLARR